MGIKNKRKTPMIKYIKIDEEIIENSNIADNQTCPIANGLKKAGFENVSVLPAEIYINERDEIQSSTSVQNWVHRYDAEQKVEPFTLYIDTDIGWADISQIKRVPITQENIDKGGFYSRTNPIALALSSSEYEFIIDYGSIDVGGYNNTFGNYIIIGNRKLRTDRFIRKWIETHSEQKEKVYPFTLYIDEESGICWAENTEKENPKC